MTLYTVTYLSLTNLNLCSCLLWDRFPVQLYVGSMDISSLKLCRKLHYLYTNVLNYICVSLFSRQLGSCIRQNKIFNLCLCVMLDGLSCSYTSIIFLTNRHIHFTISNTSRTQQYQFVYLIYDPQIIGHIGHITSLDYLVQITSMDYRGQSFMCGACIMGEWDVLHTTVNLNQIRYIFQR